ncbi:hypothetical protein MP228_008919 [Amoeboaphelidium protococcarum]|nr:hypothetical protein MP228_008919 [Amoeboaphelidium protococcarum]
MFKVSSISLTVYACLLAGGNALSMMPPKTEQGIATHSNPNGRPGSCGQMLDNNQMLVSLSTAYNATMGCNQCIRIQGPKGDVIAKVLDQCSGCKQTDVLLTDSAFGKIADLNVVSANISWMAAPCNGMGGGGGSSVSPSPQQTPTPKSPYQPPGQGDDKDKDKDCHTSNGRRHCHKKDDKDNNGKKTCDKKCGGRKSDSDKTRCRQSCSGNDDKKPGNKASQMPSVPVPTPMPQPMPVPASTSKVALPSLPVLAPTSTSTIMSTPKPAPGQNGEDDDDDDDEVKSDTDEKDEKCKGNCDDKPKGDNAKKSCKDKCGNAKDENQKRCLNKCREMNPGKSRNVTAPGGKNCTSCKRTNSARKPENNFNMSDLINSLKDLASKPANNATVNGSTPENKATIDGSSPGNNATNNGSAPGGGDYTCSASKNCPESNHCCSKYGYCGTSLDHCGFGCTGGACLSGFDNATQPNAPTYGSTGSGSTPGGSSGPSDSGNSSGGPSYGSSLPVNNSNSGPSYGSSLPGNNNNSGGYGSSLPANSGNNGSGYGSSLPANGTNGATAANCPTGGKPAGSVNGSNAGNGTSYGGSMPTNGTSGCPIGGGVAGANNTAGCPPHSAYGKPSSPMDGDEDNDGDMEDGMDSVYGNSTHPLPGNNGTNSTALPSNTTMTMSIESTTTAAQSQTATPTPPSAQPPVGNSIMEGGSQSASKSAASPSQIFTAMYGIVLVLLSIIVV